MTKWTLKNQRPSPTGGTVYHYVADNGDDVHFASDPSEPFAFNIIAGTFSVPDARALIMGFVDRAFRREQANQSFNQAIATIVTGAAA